MTTQPILYAVEPTETVQAKPPIPTPVEIPTAQAIPASTPHPSGQVSIMAVGDVMLARTIGENILSQGIEFPFQFTAHTLHRADITLGNLECVISESGEPENKTYNFRAPITAVDSLIFGGFDLMTLANNHVLDYGEVALVDTIDLLQSNQVAVVGAGKTSLEARQPVFIEENGLRIAFLAYLDIPMWNYDYLSWIAQPEKPGINWGYISDIQADVGSAAYKADVVIVLMHFGVEGQAWPSTQQIASARSAIDAGADLVIGSHTHLLQKVESYKDGIIVYGLGNFVFDEFSEPENLSAIFMARLNKDGVMAHKLIPVRLQDNGVPSIKR